MIRHEKASSEAQPSRLRRYVRLLFVAVAVAPLALVAALISKPPNEAVAGTVSNERPFLFAIDGSDAAGGAFRNGALTGIAVDDATGNLYAAVEGGPENLSFVSRFTAEGEAEDFPATGSSSLFGRPGEPFSLAGLSVAVDNSGGSSQGDLFVNEFGGGRLDAFTEGGNYLWSLSLLNQASGVAVDHDGHPWSLPTESADATQFETTGSPPEPTGCTIPGASGQAIVFDATGNAYVSALGEVRKYSKTGPCEYAESQFDPEAWGVYADQSNAAGPIFTAQTGSFQEYDPAGDLLGTYGGAYLSQEGPWIAYNPTKDWVYVAQQFEPHPVIAVFGAPQSGLTPDATETAAALSGAGVSTAHLSGKVNPRGLSTDAHFEWKREGESWVSAAARQSSPPVAVEPADETEHAVVFDTDELRGNSTYEVRLVAVNSASKLAGFSTEVQTITTNPAPEAPDVAISSLSSAGPRAATVEGTINPKGDTADWQVELDRGCSGEFVGERRESLRHSSTSPVPVAYELTGLLPSESYCVRISATNSFGESTSETSQVETEGVPPDEVETAFAAPRLDTSARLNARVNPEGAPLTYRFEYSPDGGASWVPLEIREDTSESRHKIVIGEELRNLTPGMTYVYRVGVASNGSGPALTLGDEKGFTTRSSGEVNPPASCPNEAVRLQQHVTFLADCRGVELINNPDKGNQNLAEGEGSASGNQATWTVGGGAPNSPTGSLSSFRAERTPAGWQSTSIVPPVEEQIGGGNWSYLLEAETPEFGTIIAGATNLRNHHESALVRIVPGQSQEVLRQFPEAALSTGFAGGAMTDDGAHVLFLNSELEPARIEEVGNGEPTEVVSILPDGSEAECLSKEGEGDNFTGSSGPGRGAGRDWRPGYQRISEDASRVYFQVHPNGECPQAGLALYERNRAAGVTTLIDPGTPPAEPHIVRVTPDGKTAYFGTTSSCSKWSDGPTPTCEIAESADTDKEEDVYRWDEESGEAHCVTCNVQTPGGEPVGNIALDPSDSILVSDSFTHIYFTSRDKLAPPATAGDPNIYALTGGVLHFVANLSGARQLEGLHNGTADLSADGKTLLFSATPDPSLTADAVATEAGDEELYRYEEGDGSLECVTCAHARLTDQARGPAFDLSQDGTTLAFETVEALSDRDINRAEDVYEWRSGVVSLVTDGTAEDAAPTLRGVNRDGSNIFFTAIHPGLTGFEQDGLRNFYDARTGGGFMPPPAVPHCSEDSCQGPLAPAPQAQQPGTSTYTGPGNVRTRANCAAISRRARRARAESSGLRQKAAKADQTLQATGMRRKARKLSRKAHRLEKRAKACRGANRGGTR